MPFSLGDIAERFQLELRGDPGQAIAGVCSLAHGVPDRLSYLSDPSYASTLRDTRAGAVILADSSAGDCPSNALIASDPKLAYAQVAALFLAPRPEPGAHPSAVVDPGAQIDLQAYVGPQVVVEAGAQISAGVVLNPGCVIGAGVIIGENSEVGANASIGAGVVVGARVRVGPNVILGDRGFGLTHDGAGWQPIPQLGGVLIGNDVEIGAGSTIDRGAIENTEIGDGVKIDDQVHIAHNCKIGVHSVIAGCTGIAGSTRIGKNCVIGGGVGIGDHVTITDNVMLTGASQVPKDITEPGVHSSTFRAMPAGEWRKRLALFRKLDSMEARLRDLKKAMTK